MRAEHPTGDVRLVDDHDRQPQEEVRPARVVGQQRRVEHVRVREHEVRVATDQRALGGRSVPVVHGGAQLGQLEHTHLPELIPRERLRRVEPQGRRLLAVERGRCEGHGRSERLPRGGPRGEHHVAACQQRTQGARLVRVQALDPEQLEPAGEQVGDLRRERLEHRRDRGELTDVGQRPGAIGIGADRVEEGVGIHTGHRSHRRRDGRGQEPGVGTGASSPAISVYGVRRPSRSSGRIRSRSRNSTPAPSSR